jgi:hypothetical protein
MMFSSRCWASATGRKKGDRPILARRGFFKGRCPQARPLDHLNHPYNRNSRTLGREVLGLPSSGASGSASCFTRDSPSAWGLVGAGSPSSRYYRGNILRDLWPRTS